MRKLIESYDVSEDVRQRQFPVRRYDLTGNPPDLLCPDVADSYDLDNGRRRTLSIAELCHEIIHSFVFTFFCGETADLFDGVFVLEVDIDTLHRRLEERPDSEWGGGEPVEWELVARSHQTKEDIPQNGISIDAAARGVTFPDAAS